jgi:hypothetical protein
VKEATVVKVEPAGLGLDDLTRMRQRRKLRQSSDLALKRQLAFWEAMLA